MPGTASSPEPQGRSRLVNPIEAALTAALPISVSMTLRERFMACPLARFKADRRAALNSKPRASAPAREGMREGAEAATRDAAGG